MAFAKKDGFARRGSERVAWYVALEDAWRSGDAARAAEASRVMAQLGVRVARRRGRGRQERGTHAGT